MAYEVTVVEAAFADKSVVRNLMNLYLYDFTEFGGEAPDAHGLFEYKYLDHYWTSDGREEGRVPFLVRVNGELAGFALVRRSSYVGNPAPGHTFAEFFIMRKWRKAGVGRAVACEIFRLFPGPWEVAQVWENLPAQAFWRKVIGAFTGGRFTEVDSPGEWEGPVQIFTV